MQHASQACMHACIPIWHASSQFNMPQRIMKTFQQNSGSTKEKEKKNSWKVIFNKEWVKLEGKFIHLFLSPHVFYLWKYCQLQRHVVLKFLKIFWHDSVCRNTQQKLYFCVIENCQTKKISSNWKGCQKDKQHVAKFLIEKY